MSYETLTYTVAEGVGLVTLNRPQAANAMSPQMAKDLHAVALQIEGDSDVRAVVITGAGKMFCAGGDLGAFAEAGDDARRLLLQMTGDLHLSISRLARHRTPVIAAVNGTAAGGGLSLAMSADLVLSAEEAVFTMAYAGAGLSPDGSSTYFLPRKVGDSRARELMLTNRVLSAQEALDWGMVNRIYAANELQEAALNLAGELANGPTQAYGQVKSLLNATFDNGLETQMELEARGIAAMVASQDGKEGIAAFLEKRAPKFLGR